MSDTQSRPDDVQPERAAPQPAAGSLDPKIGGLLAYLLFGWVGGLIMFLTQKHPEVRFHGAQSVLVSIATFGLYAVLGVLSSVMAIGFGGWALFSALYSLIGLAVLGLWISLCVKGYNLDHFKLPVIGDIAERWARSSV